MIHLANEEQNGTLCGKDFPLKEGACYFDGKDLFEVH
jgi:hypothetical protein